MSNLGQILKRISKEKEYNLPLEMTDRREEVIFVSQTNVTDMTVGKPLSHILAFTAPLLIGNLFQQFYNIVDSIVVGRYVGKNALAAVGACGATNFMFFALSMGLAGGIGVIISQNFGAKNESVVRKAIANSYYISVVVALFFGVLSFLLAPAILRALDTPAVIIGDAITYMRITSIGIVGISVYNGISTILRSLGDSKTPLYFLIFSTIVNVLLDLLFVIKFSLGVGGVALATIVAQYLSAIVALIYALVKMPYFRSTRQELIPDWKLIDKAFRLGVPLAVQSSMIAVSCMVLQGVVNGFGENVVAAFTITGRVEQIVQQPYGSIGTAIMTFAGQNMGAKQLDRVKKGFWQTVLVVLVFSIALIPIMYVFGKQIAGIFVTDVAVIDMVSKALRITCWAYFPLGMIYVPRALLNGCGDAVFAMINGITEVAGRVCFSLLFIHLSLFGFWSVWVTTGCTWILTALVCMWRYFEGKWTMKQVVS